MEDVLDVYAEPHDPKRPVVCFDECSKELHGHVADPIPAAPGHPAKEDYEYVRNGTANLFVIVEPLAGTRHVTVTDRRTIPDFAAQMKYLCDELYPDAEVIRVVLDNLNTHFRKSFDDVMGKRAAAKLLRRVQFHYTPKHASWLNMAEIEIGILSRQCLDRRIASRELLQTEVDAWQEARNADERTIEWKFTRQDADHKLGRHYVSTLAC